METLGGAGFAGLSGELGGLGQTGAGSAPGMVAVVRGLPNAGLAVTVLDSGKQYTLLPNYVLEGSPKDTPPPRNFVNCAANRIVSQRSTATDANRDRLEAGIRCNSSAQATDGRYASIYQTTHCRVKPTSPPVQLTEFPPQRPQVTPGQCNFVVGGTGSGDTNYSAVKANGSFRGGGLMWTDRESVCTPRASRSPDAFATSLRKYPALSPDRSSEIIERLITYTQAKNFTKTQSRLSPTRIGYDSDQIAFNSHQTSTRSPQGGYEPEINTKLRLNNESPTRDRPRKVDFDTDYKKPFCKNYDVRFMRDMSRQVRENIKNMTSPYVPHHQPVCTSFQEKLYQSVPEQKMQFEQSVPCMTNTETQAATQMVCREVGVQRSTRNVAIPATPEVSELDHAPEGGVSNYKPPQAYKSVQTYLNFPPTTRKSVQTTLSSIELNSSKSCHSQITRKSRSELNMNKEDVKNEIIEWLQDIFRNTDPEDKVLCDDVLKKLSNKLKRCSKNNKDNEKTNSNCSEDFCKSSTKQMHNDLVNKIRFKSRYTSTVFRAELNHFRISDNFETIIKDWLDHLPLKTHDFLGSVVDRQALLVSFVNRLKYASNREEFDKKRLKSEILEILDELPLVCERNKISFMITLANTLIKKLQHVNSNNGDESESKVDNDDSCHCNDDGQVLTLKRNIQPTADEMKEFVKDELGDFVEKFHSEIDAKQLEDIEDDIVDILMNSTDAIYSNNDNHVSEEIVKLMRDFGGLFEHQAIYLANLLLKHLKQMFNLIEESQLSSRKINRLETYVLLSTGSNHTTNETTDFSNSGLSEGEKQANLDFFQQLSQQIDEWLTNLPVPLPSSYDPSFRQVVIHDLANDIVDRHKYLEFSPVDYSEEDELENLKYQIFKWINKLVGENSTETIDHAPELMQRIQSIPVPMQGKLAKKACCRYKIACNPKPFKAGASPRQSTLGDISRTRNVNAGLNMSEVPMLSTGLGGNRIDPTRRASQVRQPSTPPAPSSASIYQSIINASARPKINLESDCANLSEGKITLVGLANVTTNDTCCPSITPLSECCAPFSQPCCKNKSLNLPQTSQMTYEQGPVESMAQGPRISASTGRMNAPAGLSNGPMHGIQIPMFGPGYHEGKVKTPLMGGPGYSGGISQTTPPMIRRASMGQAPLINPQGRKFSIPSGYSTDTNQRPSLGSPGLGARTPVMDSQAGRFGMPAGYSTETTQLQTFESSGMAQAVAEDAQGRFDMPDRYVSETSRRASLGISGPRTSMPQTPVIDSQAGRFSMTADINQFESSEPRENTSQAIPMDSQGRRFNTGGYLNKQNEMSIIGRTGPDGSMAQGSQQDNANATSSSGNPGTYGVIYPDAARPPGSTFRQPSPVSAREISDEYDAFVRNWVLEIPIPGSTKEEQALADKMRLGLYNGIWKAVTKLKCQPQIMVNPFYYEDALDDEIEELFSLLLQTSELLAKKHMLKVKLIEKTCAMNEMIKVIYAPDIFKQKLVEKIEVYVPRLTTEDRDVNTIKLYEELQKLRLAEDFILYVRYKEDDPVKANVYRKKVLQRVQELVDDLKTNHGKELKDINSEIYVNDIINALHQVPLPSENTVREEADEILMGLEIEQWYKDLPLAQNNDSSEQLKRRRLRDVLGKKLHEMEKVLDLTDGSAYMALRNEISKFLDKLPLGRDESLNINFMVDELTNRIKNRARERILESSRRKSVAFYDSVAYRDFSTHVPSSPCVTGLPAGMPGNAQQYPGSGMTNTSVSQPGGYPPNTKVHDPGDYRLFDYNRPITSTFNELQPGQGESWRILRDTQLSHQIGSNQQNLGQPSMASAAPQSLRRQSMSGQAPPANVIPRQPGPGHETNWYTLDETRAPPGMMQSTLHSYVPGSSPHTSGRPYMAPEYAQQSIPELVPQMSMGQVLPSNAMSWQEKPEQNTKWYTLEETRAPNQIRQSTLPSYVSGSEKHSSGRPSIAYESAQQNIRKQSIPRHGQQVSMSQYNPPPTSATSGSNWKTITNNISQIQPGPYSPISLVQDPGSYRAFEEKRPTSSFLNQPNDSESQRYYLGGSSGPPLLRAGPYADQSVMPSDMADVSQVSPGSYTPNIVVQSPGGYGTFDQGQPFSSTFNQLNPTKGQNYAQKDSQAPSRKEQGQIPWHSIQQTSGPGSGMPEYISVQNTNGKQQILQDSSRWQTFQDSAEVQAGPLNYPPQSGQSNGQTIPSNDNGSIWQNVPEQDSSQRWQTMQDQQMRQPFPERPQQRESVEAGHVVPSSFMSQQGQSRCCIPCCDARCACQDNQASQGGICPKLGTGSNARSSSPKVQGRSSPQTRQFYKSTDREGIMQFTENNRSARPTSEPSNTCYGQPTDYLRPHKITKQENLSKCARKQAFENSDPQRSARDCVSRRLNTELTDEESDRERDPRRRCRCMERMKRNKKRRQMCCPMEDFEMDFAQCPPRMRFIYPIHVIRTL